MRSPRCEAARTPFERVRECAQADPEQVAKLEELRKRLDSFQLSRIIDRKLDRIGRLANRRLSPKVEQQTVGNQQTNAAGQRLWKGRSLRELGNRFAISTFPQPQQQQTFGYISNVSTTGATVTFLNGLTGSGPIGAKQSQRFV